MKRNICICIFIVTLLITAIIPREVYAGGALENVISGGESFIQDGQNEANKKIDPDKSAPFIKSIYSILMYILVIVALIWGLILAISFMVGSVEQKAKVKEHMIPYVVGIVVASAAFAIWRLVVTTLDS